MKRKLYHTVRGFRFFLGHRLCLAGLALAMLYMTVSIFFKELRSWHLIYIHILSLNNNALKMCQGTSWVSLIYC